MPKIKYHDRFKDDEGNWHKTTHTFNTDKSTFICNTPDGRLYKKGGRRPGYFLYRDQAKTNREHITVLSWKEANQYCRTYGTKLLHQKYFSVNGKSDHVTHNRSIYLSPKDWVKVERNANFLKMNTAEFIRYLINKYDSGRSYQ